MFSPSGITIYQPAISIYGEAILVVEGYDLKTILAFQTVNCEFHVSFPSGTRVYTTESNFLKNLCMLKDEDCIYKLDIPYLSNNYQIACKTPSIDRELMQDKSIVTAVVKIGLDDKDYLTCSDLVNCIVSYDLSQSFLITKLQPLSFYLGSKLKLRLNSSNIDLLNQVLTFKVRAFH